MCFKSKRQETKFCFVWYHEKPAVKQNSFFHFVSYAKIGNNLSFCCKLFSENKINLLVNNKILADLYRKLSIVFSISCLFAWHVCIKGIQNKKNEAYGYHLHNGHHGDIFPHLSGVFVSIFRWLWHTRRRYSRTYHNVWQNLWYVGTQSNVRHFVRLKNQN